MLICSNRIRQSARGEQCTLNFVGICNHNPETVVLAHIRDENKGMGQKADDISACYACSDCHRALDENKHGLSNSELYKTLLKALQRTIKRLVEKKIVKIIDVNIDDFDNSWYFR